MQGLLALSRAIDGLTAKFGWIADWMVLLSCLVSAGNALMRYAISYSSNAFLEIQWYMFGVMVLLGASHTLRMNEHVRVDIIYGIVSDRTRLWIDTLGLIIFLIPIAAFLVWLSWPVFMESYRLQEMSQNAGGLIVWPIKLVLPLGFALLFLQGISELIKRLAALAGTIEIETKYEKPLQ